MAQAMTETDLAGALLVEDEIFVVLDMEDTLRHHGIRVAASCSSIAQALEWLESNRPNLAVIDYRLRDGTSEKIAKVLRTRNVPTVVYSANSFEPPLHEEDFGTFPWVDKPSDAAVLMAAIQAAMGRFV